MNNYDRVRVDPIDEHAGAMTATVITLAALATTVLIVAAILWRLWGV